MPSCVRQVTRRAGHSESLVVTGQQKETGQEVSLLPGHLFTCPALAGGYSGLLQAFTEREFSRRRLASTATKPKPNNATAGPPSGIVAPLAEKLYVPAAVLNVAM